MEDRSGDPVLARREQAKRVATLARRVGWGAIAASAIAFFAGLATEEFGTTSIIVIGALVLATVTLAPGIVLGYAVRAAEREDPSSGPP